MKGGAMPDSTTLDERIIEHGPALSRLCAALCGNRADAEDLYQDTWLKVIRFIDGYDADRPFQKWLFTIAVNSFRNTKKSAWAKRHYEFPSQDSQQRFFDSIPDKDTPREDYEALATCVAQLPDKLRVVVVLKYVSDYSEADVARLLGLPEGTVKSRLFNARRILKEEL